MGDIRKRWLFVTPRKIVVKVPGGEVQFGRLSRTLTLWFRGKAYHRVMRNG